MLMVLFVSEPLQARQNKVRVWIDTDAACTGAFAVDVDDCWALALLLRDTTVEIVGISTVFGNRRTATSEGEMRRILHAISPNASQTRTIPVVEGASRPPEIFNSSPNLAAKAIIEKLEKSPLTILALGPLTNIASVVARRPDLSGRISNIVAIAGQRPGERFFPGRSRFFHVHDMNFRKDVTAFKLVLESHAAVTLVPYIAGSQVIIGKKDLAHLQQGNRQTQWLADTSRGWLEFWEAYFGVSGFYPFDLLGAAYLTVSDGLKCRQTRARIVYRRGLFTVRDTLEVDADSGRYLHYCDEVTAQLGNQLVSRFLKRAH